jgi:transposase
MPRAYSTDLRERALAACEAGEGSQARIAERFRVGERTLSGWLKAAREEGRRSPEPRGGGRALAGGEAEALGALVAERNDATLAEYADRLAERAGARRSPSALCRALQALGLVRKKRRSGPPSRTAGASSRRGRRGGGPSRPGSRPSGWPSSTRPGSTPG